MTTMPPTTPRPTIGYLDIGDPRLGADIGSRIISCGEKFVDALGKNGIAVVSPTLAPPFVAISDTLRLCKKNRVHVRC